MYTFVLPVHDPKVCELILSSDVHRVWPRDCISGMGCKMVKAVHFNVSVNISPSYFLDLVRNVRQFCLWGGEEGEF